MLKTQLVESLGHYGCAAHCAGCGGKNQAYMLEWKLWDKVCKKIGMSKDILLCLLCVEKILGRPLQEKDFLLEAPINHGSLGFNYKDWLNAE